MKSVLFLTLLGVFVCAGPSATAEVFTCKEADGTTVFSHVPCRAASKPVQPPPIYIAPEYSYEPDPIDIGSAIADLELELDDLRKAREQEIADAPFSTSNPSLLADLKTEIRANYQARIDENLTKLIELRNRQMQPTTAE